MTGPRFERARWGLAALTAAGLVVLLGPMARFSLGYFTDPFEDLHHGWLVVAVSAAAVWQVRARLRAAAGAPDWRGVAALLACLGLFWFGQRGSQLRLSQLGIIGSVAALPFAFWGVGVARLLLFPCANLLFAMPLGFLDVLAVRLHALAAAVSAGLLNGAGIPARHVGTAVSVAGRYALTLDVTDLHVAMRSLCACAAVTAGYAWLTQRTRRRRFLLQIGRAHV